MADTNNPVIKRVKERLVSGEITKDQAAQVLQAYRSRQSGEQAPEAPPLLSAPEAQQPQAPDMAQIRQQAMDEVAADVGPLEAFMIGTGKGFMDIGRGIGLVDPATEGDKQALEALREKRPYTTGSGEIVGQTAPFVPAGMGAGLFKSLAGRVAAGTGLGATEGGIIAGGTGRDVLSGSGMGAAIGGGAEILFPIIGRLGRSLYRKVKGKAPQGALLDAAGRPTTEFQSVLDEYGLSLDDLTADAQSVVRNAKPGSNPEQVGRAALFAEEGVPMTRGQLTQGFEQIATEERLMKSTMDPNAAPFREYKANQSESIRRALEKGVDLEQTSEETGNLIKDALSGRKKLLRTQKNDLYREALDNVDNVESLPLMLNTEDMLPDARTLRGLDRASKGSVSDVMDTLAEYGLAEPSERLLSDPNFSPSVLTLQNFEEVNQILKGISRNDPSGATGNLVSRLTEAIDDEVANLADSATDMNLSDKVIKPLRDARKVVTELKNEFNPKALSGQMIDVKRGSNEPAIYGSKVYDKLVSKASPVEGVRATMANLRRGGEKGEQAIADLQSTMMLDLLDAGFGTKSRKIEGIPVFNPNAFQRRLERIGDEKLKAIFQTNPSTLQRLKNIDKISTSLIPPADATPKGSAPVLMDIMQRLGAAGISTKIPGAGLFFDKMGDIAQNYGTRKAVRQAIKADPDIAKVAYRLDREFPGIASALGIAGISTMDEEADDDPDTDQ